MSMTRSLISGFLRSADERPEAPALEVQGRTLTFRELREQAARIAATLRARSDAVTGLTAVFAYRSETAFAGILGTLLRGHGYVPLNRTFPPERTRVMLERSGSAAVVVDAESAKQLPEVVEGVTKSLTFLVPDLTDVGDLRERLEGHDVIAATELEPAAGWDAPDADPDAIAYLLFTSGSTGIPKGVMVAHRNVLAFLDFVVDRYDISASDRMSQTFDMTFDLSVFDMFTAWERGACVCCPSSVQLLRPDRYVNDAALSLWFAVPSAGIYMNRVGMLKPEAFPSLRLSLFCGEPLPVDLATRWSQAAPNSVVENLYGPTELTIACMYQPWDSAAKESSEYGTVPIGRPFPEMTPMVVDDRLEPVAAGEAGELIMAGPQVTLGYLNDAEKTEAAFVVPPGKSATYYRTGDRVRQASPDGPYLYIGRVDHQIKVRGHRVELGEIEAAIRKAASVDAVVAVGWPRSASGASGVEAFLADTVDTDGLRTRLAQVLPDYMIPKRMHVLDALPLNSNGKFDRPALVQLLEDGL
jgi:amino acid adenylation domain-containing protein